MKSLLCPSCDKPVDVPGKCDQCRLEDACEATAKPSSLIAALQDCARFLMKNFQSHTPEFATACKELAAAGYELHRTGEPLASLATSADAIRGFANDLRMAGYAVVMFNPSELGDVDPRTLENRLVELGNEAISDLTEGA